MWNEGCSSSVGISQGMPWNSLRIMNHRQRMKLIKGCLESDIHAFRMENLRILLTINIGNEY